MKKLEFVLTFALIALISVASITFGDWNPGDAAKWIQLPDLSPLGLDICVDNLNRPGGSQRVIGDDFECKSTDKITGVHLWVSYKGDPDPRPQIQGITLGIWSDNPQGPNGHSEPLTQLWTYQATPADFVERLYFTLPDIGEGWWDPAYSGWIPNADNNIWQININVDPSVAFEQQGSPDLPVIYWLTVEIQLPIESTDAIGWKTRDRWDGQYMDAAVWYTTPPIPWHALLYPAGHEYEPDKIDMAFVLTSDEGPVIDKDYGDAPEGAIAYPSLGVTGSFPTCITIGPSGYIEHGLCWAHFEMVPPPGFDFEPDGNGGLCPGFAPYDNDECFMDGDAGLIFPDAYTIQGGTVVTCPQSTASSLGNTCTTATWGANVDIYVVNNMPVIGYVNVLMDWNQSGSWGGSSSCGIAAAAEYVLQDFPVPVGFAGPLSSLMPAGTGFLLGPNPGYIWTRFMISEARLVNPQWDGSGIFEDGETEDYLLRVDYQTDYLDFGDAPDSAAAAGYPTLLANSGANHIIAGPWLGDATDSPDAEADGQPDATATGDDIDANGDDEDGVNIPILQAGQPATITFEVNGGGGTVTGWIDYDASQSWDASEQVVATNYPVNGVYNVNITVPTTAVVGQTFARFRITTQGVLGPTGSAPDGEVEDLEVYIEPGEPEPVLKFQQKPLNGPEYFGHDELSTAYRDPDNTIQFEGCYMADDFADLADTPVIKIKWWGSYIENEIMEPVVRFLIAFETDIPAVGQPGDIDYVASHPGQVLQTEIVHLSSTVPLNPGEYSETWIGSGGPPCFENLFEYEAVLENPFPEEPDTVYWIKIVALIDDPAVLARVKPALQLSGLSLCQFLKLPFAQQMEFGLQMPVTRWGWHNRDYMIMDPYASTPPAVVPGEHLAGITSEGFEVWHFQDDAVSGEMIMDESDPIMPFVYQYNWMEEYYVYSLPYCYPPPPGVDGPQDIVEFSKDLAFELYTHAPTECFDNTHADYAEWLNAGSPQCWCYKFQCYGDSDGAEEGDVKKGYYWVS
ncbi:MAG: hypothetical protein JW912_04835, partial [Sedimentisphaerales bacterium]|nr:hypothetical protein [Sedimentisphaerales bacterium]